MNDFDDELLSAVLDDEASDDEVRRVRDDPRLSDRLAELRAARDVLRSAPVPMPGEAQREVAITAALRAAPTPIRAPRRRLVRTAVAAALILLVVGGLAGLAAISRSSRDHGSQTAAQAAATASSSGFVAPSPSAASPSAPSSAGGFVAADGAQPGTAAQAIDLGPYPTADSLAAAARAALARTTASAEQAPHDDAAPAAPLNRLSTDPSASLCPVQPDELVVARATLAGAPVVVSLRGQPGAQTLLITDASCVVVLSQPR